MVNSSAINPDEFISAARQSELFIMAEHGCPLTAIMTAIRETVYAVKLGIVVEAENEPKGRK